MAGYQLRPMSKFGQMDIVADAILLVRTLHGRQDGSAKKPHGVALRPTHD